MERIGLIALRKQYGLTQADIAEIIGCSRQAVIKWEKGLHPIPDTVEPKLLAANLGAPATKKNAGKVVNAGTHPACYHAQGKNTFARTLLHPKWWAGVGTPFSKLVSIEQWEAVDARAMVSDLETYIAPSIEQAHALMVSRGITFNDASGYLLYMGYALPSELQPVRDPYLVAQEAFFRTSPDATLDEFLAAYPQFKPAAPVGFQPPTRRNKMSQGIEKVYTRYYRDNRQLTAYVEWADGSRTEGPAEMYHGLAIPSGTHMGALFDRAIREGLTVERQIW